MAAETVSSTSPLRQTIRSFSRLLAMQLGWMRIGAYLEEFGEDVS